MYSPVNSSLCLGLVAAVEQSSPSGPRELLKGRIRMAASCISMAASSSVKVNDSASLAGEEVDRVDSGQTAGPETRDTAAMVDCPEYWIG